MPPEGPVPLRRELLLSFAVLFSAAVLLAMLAAALVLPTLASPEAATLFLFALLGADLVVLFGFGSWLLRDRLVRPVERMLEDVRLMTEGGTHRVGAMPAAELQAIGESVNELADRLMKDQERLAENVESLERTNAELAEARGQLVRSARLASLGTLAAGIGHEIGNPLAAIIGYVDVARSRAVKEGRDPSLLDGARDEALRIDGIVRSLLDYARPRGTEPDRVDPGAVVHRVRDLLEAQGRVGRVKLEVSVDRDLPLVRVEPSRLEQVLINLLLNALDAVSVRVEAAVHVRAWREPGAAMALAARREGDPSGVNYLHRRRLRSGAPEGEVDPLLMAREVVAIRIADNGPGIPEGDLARIFDPFFTTKPPGKGTGLGLAICAQLVESMGGRIHAENAEGGGAAFTLRIPAGPAEEAP